MLVATRDIKYTYTLFKILIMFIKIKIAIWILSSLCPGQDFKRYLWCATQ